MPKPAKKSNKDFEDIRSKLKIKHLREKSKLEGEQSKSLSSLKEKGIDVDNIRTHSAKLLGAGAVFGALMLPSPGDLPLLPPPNEVVEKINHSKNVDIERNMKNLLTENIASIIPKTPRPLTRTEEKLIEVIFNDVIGVKAKANLEGEHLNTTYGYIGAEQHLRRYPGDTLSEHGTGQVLREGMAPGLGAWGYFAPSREQMTPQLVETEKWYAVVQTLYLPDWNTRQPYLKNWYKHRKILIVNTQNGNAVVASIADSGPAAWTGKQYGGSPEVMHYLGGPRYKKGPVVVFFIDDPENKVELGPVEYDLSAKHNESIDLLSFFRNSL